MANRITAKYQPGNGDLGHSTVLHGHKLRKDHPACRIQGQLESLRHEIEVVLSETELQQRDLTYLLEWLDRNIFSLASFCYLKGDTVKHVLPMDLLHFLDEKTQQLKSQVGDCPDFLAQSHRTLVKLDGIRIEARRLESYYVQWWYSSEMVEHLMGREDLIYGVRKHAAILNRLSAYLFEAMRMEGKLLAEVGYHLEQRVWSAEVEGFDPPEEMVEMKASLIDDQHSLFAWCQ